MDYFLTKVDKLVTGTLSEWDRLSTTLFILSICSIVYFIIYTREPDTHPLFLERQTQASPVRQKGESAIFRSHSAPHGTALISGLNIRNPGDSKWTHGKDGDLRDIWKRAITGAQDRLGNDLGKTGKLFTLQGTSEVIEHDLNEITKQISSIGHYLKKNQSKRVAIYLPNSVEFLASLFACAFHESIAILLKYDQSPTSLLSQLERAKADTVITASGSFPFDLILEQYSELKQLVFVVDEGSKHIDWKEVPVGLNNDLNISTWHEIVQSRESSTEAKFLSYDSSTDLKPVIVFTAEEMVEFTQENIIAGIAGQLTSVPSSQIFTPSDLFLPIDCLSAIYPLTLTLAALFSNADIALTAVASHSPSLTTAVRGISPTVIAASSTTMIRFHDETKKELSSPLYSLVHWLEERCLTRKGYMPTASVLSSVFKNLYPIIGNAPGKLRLIYISSLVGVDKPISSLILSDLRIFIKSRIIYALTAPQVAGAVSQTGVFDYRLGELPNMAHFGAPVTSLELYFQDKGEYRNTDFASCGEIIVNGPAVVGGKARLRVVGMMNRDLTLRLLESSS
ncbi:hypothetical protein EPUL_000641, partial [Erysiphe pulchra]